MFSSHGRVVQRDTPETTAREECLVGPQLQGPPPDHGLAVMVFRSRRRTRGEGWDITPSLDFLERILGYWESYPCLSSMSSNLCMLFIVVLIIIIICTVLLHSVDSACSLIG